MRFLTLKIDRYGAFADRELIFREEAPVHVVLGRNEAGKSTALHAIGDLLFGFPQTTDFAFLHEQTTLRVGATLQLANGDKFGLRRRKGRKNTLFDENDKPLDDALLAPILGAVSRKLFFSEFGLTSAALREGGRELLETGGRLAETLAAASSRLTALSQLRGRFASEADEMFSARRVASKPFYLACDRHQAIERLLREKIVSADALASAEMAVAEAKERRVARSAAHDENGRELARLRRASRTQPRLRRLDSLRAELQGLADLPAADSKSLALWRAAIEDEARCETAIAEQETEAENDAAAIAALLIDEPLYRLGSAIDALRERLGAVRKAEEDLPRRNESARLARAALADSARRLGLAHEDELLARQPTDAALAALRELIAERATAERRLAEAFSAQAEAKREAAQLEETAASDDATIDPSSLIQRFAAFADVSADADRLRREAAQIAQDRRSLEEDCARLDPFSGAPEALARLALPQAQDVEAVRQRFAALDEEETRVVGERKALRARIATIEAEIAALERAGAVATREDLNVARAERETAYRTLGVALEDDAGERLAGYLALGAAERRLDATTDLLLSGAERSARFAAARERRLAEQHALDEVEAAEAARQARAQEANAAWSELWRASALAPRAPAQMLPWLARANEILHRRARLEAREPELAALALKLDAQRAALAAIAREVDAPSGAELGAEALYKLTRAALDRRQAAWTEARAVCVLRENATRAVTRAQRNTAERENEAKRLRAEWPLAVEAIGLRGEAGVAEAEAALAVWNGAPMQKKEFFDQEHRVETMRHDILSFEKAVGDLVAAAAPDLADLAPREALDLMSRRLSDTRAAHQKREGLREAAAKRHGLRAKLAQGRDAAAATLAAARAALALTSEAPLGPALQRVERRNACAAELEACLRDLLESADGRNEATLRAEQADLDPDLAPGAIERLEIESREIMEDFARAEAALHDASRKRDELVQGRDAAGAARDRAEASAEIVSIARRWLLRAGAARLATLAIERHRAAVEDPLIARAAQLLAIATDGAFAGLSADYDEDDRPTLKGVRASGERVAIGGMSEGTRDQLFLALRLALLELRGGEPLPFVGDDLLASFDETRTARALELLADFGRARQAIIFTHHRHVAEIAEQLSVGADIIQL